MPSLTTRARTSLAIVLAGLAIGSTVRGMPFADASTYVLMAGSLWHDGDLVYAPEDRARADELLFGDLPANLLLSKHAWGYAYGKPFVYPALAVPFFAAFGVRGFFVLNGLLLAGLVLLGADILSHRLPRATAAAVSAAVVGLSVTPAYVEWIDPFLACSILAAGALAAYRRGRPATTALLLATLAACRPPYFALAAAPLALYLVDRRWGSLARFGVVAAAAAAFYTGVGYVANESWTPYASERFCYPTEFPYDTADAEAEEIGVRTDDPVHNRPRLGLRDIAGFASSFLIGRFAGVLVYFPGLLACVLWSRRWDREKVAWGLALLAACGAILVAFPENYFGGRHALGNRLFTLLPIALVFVDFIAWRPWRVLATAGLAVFALPVARNPTEFSYHPGLQMVQAPYRYLPLEWTHLTRMELPFVFPGMAALTDNQYSWEGEGLWTRGGKTAVFVFLRPAGEAPRVQLLSPLAAVHIYDGGEPLSWSPGSRDVTLTRPVGAIRSIVNLGPTDVYTLTISTDAIFRPKAHGDSVDNRSLGVFVRPLDRTRSDDSPSRPNRVRPWWEPPGQ